MWREASPHRLILERHDVLKLISMDKHESRSVGRFADHAQSRSILCVASHSGIVIILIPML